MVDKKKVYLRVARSWLHTALVVIAIVLWMGILLFIGERFISPRLLLGILGTGASVTIFSFFAGEIIVNTIGQASKPHPTEHVSFIAAVDDLCGWLQPRLYVLKFGEMPNAVAYGWGIPGMSAIGITQELYDMLSPDELKAVVAHELGHIRSLDVGLMTTVALVTGSAEVLSRLLLQGKTGLARTPAAMVFGGVLWFFAKVVFPIGRGALSQEREYSADALSALYTGEPRNLASALRKLDHELTELKADQGDDLKAHNVLDDLMLSHPGMDKRVAAVEYLEQK